MSEFKGTKLDEKVDSNLQDKKFKIEKERLLTAIENGHVPTDEEIEKFNLDVVE